MSQASQHFRSSETQDICEGCFARQSISSVIFLHSSMSKTVHSQESNRGPSVYQHKALSLGQTGSLDRGLEGSQGTNRNLPGEIKSAISDGRTLNYASTDPKLIINESDSVFILFLSFFYFSDKLK